MFVDRVEEPVVGSGDAAEVVESPYWVRAIAGSKPLPGFESWRRLWGGWSGGLRRSGGRSGRANSASFARKAVGCGSRWSLRGILWTGSPYGFRELSRWRAMGNGAERWSLSVLRASGIRLCGWAGKRSGD
jgi:hypothetical protein